MKLRVILFLIFLYYSNLYNQTNDPVAFITGEWIRTQDMFSNSIIKVEKYNGVAIGKLTFLNDELKKFGFFENDVKWKDFKRLSNTKIYVYDLIRDTTGKKVYTDATIDIVDDDTIELRYFSQFRENQVQIWKRLKPLKQSGKSEIKIEDKSKKDINITVEAKTDANINRDISTIKSEIAKLKTMIISLTNNLLFGFNKPSTNITNNLNTNTSNTIIPKEEDTIEYIKIELAKLRADIENYLINYSNMIANLAISNFTQSSDNINTNRQTKETTKPETNKLDETIEKLIAENNDLRLQIKLLEEKITKMAEELSKPKYSKDEFDLMLLGKTREKAIELLGSPDRIDKSSSGIEYWFYNKAEVYDPLTRFIFSKILLTIKDGMIKAINVY